MERIRGTNNCRIPGVVEVVEHTVTQEHIQPNVRLDGVHYHAGGAHVMEYNVTKYYATKYDVMTYNVMTLDIMTYDIMTFDIMTYDIIDFIKYMMS